MLNSTQYFELVKFNPQASDGLKWTADKQAVFQLAALVITLALAIFGGLLTGRLFIMVLHHIAFYIETRHLIRQQLKWHRFAFLGRHPLAFLTLLTSEKS